MRIIAHRGASAHAPENTLGAISLAWEHQADGVEIDVRLTADNEWVVIHDADLRRTGGLRIAVEISPWARLRDCRVGAWYGPDWTSEPLPRFEQVVEALPANKHLLVEIKTDQPARVAAAWQKQTALWTSDQTATMIVMSFYARVLEAIRETGWAGPLFWLWNGRRPRLGPDARVAAFSPWDGVGLAARAATRTGMRAALREAGALASVWTVNRPADVRRCYRANWDYLTTDDPRMAREALAGISMD